MGCLVALSRPTACVTGGGAGVDSAWEQKKLEASLPWRAVQGKMLAVGGDESHLPKRSEGVHAMLGGDFAH
jgi:hypothetical protein